MMSLFNGLGLLPSSCQVQGAFILRAKPRLSSFNFSRYHCLGRAIPLNFLCAPRTDPLPFAL